MTEDQLGQAKIIEQAKAELNHLRGLLIDDRGTYIVKTPRVASDGADYLIPDGTIGLINRAVVIELELLEQKFRQL